MRPYILNETNWKEIKKNEFNLAILPWGATEAHNFHLPYGTDNIQVEKIAIESAGYAWDKGAKVIVLPVIPFGVNTGQKDIKLDLNIYPSTQAAILYDITEVLNRQGINKLLVLNGHGGNDFKSIIRELGSKFPDMLLVICNWFEALNKAEYFEHEGDHADEMETSLMLYLNNEWVLPLKEAGDGKSKKFKIKALNENWVWSERKWSKVSVDTGVGYPKKASKEKGRAYFEAVTRKIGQLLIQLAEINPDDLYE